MARRRKGVFRDLFNLAATLPWWLGVPIAGLAYFLIHPFAIEVVPNSASTAELGNIAAKHFIRAFALIGQYLLPGIFLVGAGVSVIARANQKRLLVATSEATDQGAVKSLSWREFESLVGEVFRGMGYSVKETVVGADGGVDLELRKEGELFLVQCKQWRATKVGVTTVRELFGVMAARGAVGAYVVTSGAFTREAHSFAEGRNISLIGGDTLDRLIREVRSQKSTARPASALESIPDCPVCGASMVRRVARRGSTAGSEFWGCADFPKCRGTKSM